MSTITLEQVESLATEIRNSPSTSMLGTHVSLSAVKIAQIYNALCGYATLLREREEVVSEGKLQWDEVARILGVDGDNVDAVFNAAKQVMREREAAKAGVTDGIARKLGDEYFRLCKLADRKPLQAGFWLEQLRAALEAVAPMLTRQCNPLTEYQMEKLADAAAALDIFGRRDQCSRLMEIHETLRNSPMLASAQQDFSATYHGVLIRKMVEMLKNDEWADLFTGDEILGDLQVQIARLLASARVPDEIFAALRNVFYAGWNIDKFRVACHKDLDVLRDWMLAAAPKREEG